MIFFQTNEPLVGADTDGFTDLYERAGNVVTLVTPTPLANPGHVFSVIVLLRAHRVTGRKPALIL